VLKSATFHIPGRCTPLKINMKKITFLLISFVGLYNLYSQNQITNPQFAFKIDEPIHWIEGTNKELFDNIKKFELTEEERVKILTDHNGSINISTYFEFDPKSHAGLIPTFQVNVRLNDTRNFEQFKAAMARSANSMESYFKDFKYIDEPQTVEISGIKSFMFSAKFTMTQKNGNVLKARSKTYAIPFGKYFFQINFTDGQDKKDDRSKLFKKMIQSMRIEK